MHFAISSPRGAPVMVAALAATLILVVGSGTAKADPGTVNGFSTSMTVSDTTPDPGDTITVSITHTMQSFEVPNNPQMGFGKSSSSDETPAVNLGDLALVSGSCTGDFSNCTYTPDNNNRLAFKADVPTRTTGQTVAGSAQFRVSNHTSAVETIGFNGRYAITATSGTGTPRINLTVAAPTIADLGVALTATAPPLSGTISYDAAVTNNGPAAATSATITTQLATQATSITSSSCTFSSGTHQVSCPIGSLANGATTHATFTASFGLLSLGALNATATRTASTPTDNNAANDSDSANCTALTSLSITC